MSDLYQEILEEEYPDFIIGVDECGRGSLAGPMVVCAVATFPWMQLPDLRDSKKMSRNKIHSMACFLKSETKVPYVMCVVDPAHIDGVGVEECWHEAVSHAIQVMRFKYDSLSKALVIVDGNKNPKWRTTAEKVVALSKADTFCPAVQAAAIIAKSQQLLLMGTFATIYPKYAFGRNAGYGTQGHMKALEDYGPCHIHRMSYEPMKSMGKKKGG